MKRIFYALQALSSYLPSVLVVAFESPPLSFNPEEMEKNINLAFSEPAPESGTIILSFTGNNVEYGKK